jgi:hypothetical protein
MRWGDFLYGTRFYCVASARAEKPILADRHVLPRGRVLVRAGSENADVGVMRIDESRAS